MKFKPHIHNYDTYFTNIWRIPENVWNTTNNAEIYDYILGNVCLNIQHAYEKHKIAFPDDLLCPNSKGTPQNQFHLVYFYQKDVEREENFIVFFGKSRTH